MVPMASIERSERLNVRTAPEELAMLEALASSYGVSASDVVRTLIRRAYADRFGDKKPKARK
jgi:hypothetical protein